MPRTDERAAGETSLDDVATRLRSILEPYGRMLQQTNDRGILSLGTPPTEGRNDGFYFAGVRRGKRYVSYYLMPVYTHPDLLEDLSPELRARVQGKSCFNFSRIDERLIRELESLTSRGFERYRAEGLG